MIFHFISFPLNLQLQRPRSHIHSPDSCSFKPQATTSPTGCIRCTCCICCFKDLQQAHPTVVSVVPVVFVVLKTSSSKAHRAIRVIRTIRVLLITPLRVLCAIRVSICHAEFCPKNATGFVAQRSRLHWHMKQASLPNEASFIFSGYFLDMIISVGFRVNSYQGEFLQVIGRS